MLTPLAARAVLASPLGASSGGAAPTYIQRVLAIAPASLIAYWPLSEAEGAIADNAEGTAARDGAYGSVALGQAGIGDGGVCPVFSGVAGSVVEIYSASLAAAWNGQEGTAMIWAKVVNADVWTDGVLGGLFRLGYDGGNIVQITKDSTSNQVSFAYVAGGDGGDPVRSQSASSTTWMHMAITWSKSGNAARAYFNGVQVGTTMLVPAAWTGTLNDPQTEIGALYSNDTSLFSGYLAHMAIWTASLSAPLIADLATV